MTSLPPVIAVLFERQPAGQLYQRLRSAFEAGETALFDGALSWRLEAFEAEQVWKGEAASFDQMTAELMPLLGGRDDPAVQLSIEPAA